MNWITVDERGATWGGPERMRRINKRGDLESTYDYRYTLWRWFGDDRRLKNMVAFIGLNPSTATPDKLDPTVARCEKFAMRWGFAGFCMLNAFAYRATDRAEMKSYPAPTGDPDNLTAIRWVAEHAGRVVCCWGADGSHMNRSSNIRVLLSDLDLYCLTTTKAGEPGHPLYLRGDLLPVEYE